MQGRSVKSIIPPLPREDNLSDLCIRVHFFEACSDA